MIYFLKQFIFSLIGRRATYRIGRALYQNARGDTANDMVSNGELLVQNCVVDAWKSDRLNGQRLVVFDVGANIGDWSSALVRLLTDPAMREAAELYIFEPVPSTFDFLRNRLGTQNPVLHYEQVALSSSNGVGKIYVGQGSGINSLHANPLRSDEAPVGITKVTVTDFCKTQKIQKVHLLKCDTEGHDMDVIRGALPMIVDGNISVFQFEYNYRWVLSRNFLRDAFEAIKKLPYKLVKLQSDHLLILTEWHPELEIFFEGNYALVHVDALDWFPIKRISWDRYNTMCVEG